MASAAATVQKFNDRFPIGSTVSWRSIASDKCPYRDYTVLYQATVHHGLPVAWFAEKSGMVSVEPKHVDYSK